MQSWVVFLRVHLSDNLSRLSRVVACVQVCDKLIQLVRLKGANPSASELIDKLRILALWPDEYIVSLADNPLLWIIQPQHSECSAVQLIVPVMAEEYFAYLCHDSFLLCCPRPI